MEKKKLDILLATYNGSLFLPQQIRSLQNQTFTDWNLLVHDDGSTDGTVELIREFAAHDNRITLIEDGHRLHDAGLNFMHLLQYSDASYAIFCDQDDIWLEDKLQKMIEVMDKQDSAIPQMVYSNCYVYDYQHDDISGHGILFQPTSLHDTLFLNAGIQGCALMFNAALREICKKIPSQVAMHDHVITLAAVSFGHITCIPERLMLYRRHSSAVTGHTDKNRMERAKGFFRGKKTVLSLSHFQGVRSFYDTYYDVIPEESRKVFEDFFQFEHHGRLRNAFHAFCSGYKVLGSRSILFVKLLIRPLL